MKKHLKVLLLFLLLPFWVFSQDTLHYDEGYGVGKLKNGKKKGWWVYYDKDHRIIEKKEEKKSRYQGYKFTAIQRLI